MEKIKRFTNIIKKEGAWGAWISLFAAIFLFIGAAFTPPKFVLDSSILAAGGILFSFATLFRLDLIIKTLEDGRSVKLSAGGVDVTVSAEKEIEGE